jgi:hypothetical protein
MHVSKTLQIGTEDIDGGNCAVIGLTVSTLAGKWHDFIFSMSLA